MAVRSGASVVFFIDVLTTISFHDSSLCFPGSVTLFPSRIVPDLHHYVFPIGYFQCPLWGFGKNPLDPINEALLRPPIEI